VCLCVCVLSRALHVMSSHVVLIVTVLCVSHASCSAPCHGRVICFMCFTFGMCVCVGHNGNLCVRVCSFNVCALQATHILELSCEPHASNVLLLIQIVVMQNSSNALFMCTMGPEPWRH
jgi:hypothetical protein